MGVNSGKVHLLKKFTWNFPISYLTGKKTYVDFIPYFDILNFVCFILLFYQVV